MRYLTHENEDTFWIRQGAKPHPLTKREVEKKAEQLAVTSGLSVSMRPIQEQNSSSSSGYSGNSVDTAEHAHMTNGSAQSGVGVARNGDTIDRRDMTTPDVTEKSESARSSCSIDYVNISDEEIIVRQQHAERVGYKVSTV